MSCGWIGALMACTREVWVQETSKIPMRIIRKWVLQMKMDEEEGGAIADAEIG